MSWLDTEAAERKVIRRLREILAGDALVAERFGADSIVMHPFGAYTGRYGPIRKVPTLAISREPFADARQFSDTAVAKFEIAVVGYFAPEPYQSWTLTPPAALGLGDKVPGVLTGSCRWAATIGDEFAESAVESIQGMYQLSEQADLTDEAQTLTGLPTGKDVYIYRTPLDRSSAIPRLRAYLPMNASDTFVDGLEDDPGAPDEMLMDVELPVFDKGARTMEFVKGRVSTHMQKGITGDRGEHITRAVTNLRDAMPFEDSRRGLWVVPTFILFDALIGLDDRSIR